MNKVTFLNLIAVGTAAILCNSAGSAQTSSGYKPIHRSLFLASELDHNPFWPIGWVKAASVAAIPTTESVEAPDIRPEDYILSAILLGRPPMVVINGREYAEGDFLVVMPGGQKSKVQVLQVQDGKAILRYMNKVYTILLQRKGEQSIKKVVPPQPPDTPALPTQE